MKCECGGELKYQFSAQKADQVHKIFKCVECGYEHIDVFYRYNPTTCPGHQWHFEQWGMRDDNFKHEIFQIHLCDRCGRTVHRRLDSGAVGLREAVDVEDPRILPYLQWNNDTVRFHLPKDDIAEFWK